LSAWSRGVARRHAVREQRRTPAEGAEPVQRLRGAAEAAKRVGDTTKARTYSEKLVALARDGEPTRPAVAATRQLLATR